MQRQTVSTLSLGLLAVLAFFAILWVGQQVFAPVVSAILLAVVLTPLSDLWARLRVPAALAAVGTVALAVTAMLLMMLLLEPYVTQVINRAPVIWLELRDTVEEIRRMLRGLEEVSENVASAIDANQGEGEGTGMTLPSITDALFYAPQFAAQALIFMGTLYFFLLGQSDIYDWLGRTFRPLGKHDLRRASDRVARYVLTITGINLGFGILVFVAMKVIGMPSPVLWGVLAFALNYVLYLGPIALVTLLTVTGIVVFDGPVSFLPAAIYLAMNLTEAQFVTPTLLGRSLSVNPLLIFLSLVFWVWLWGPVGGIIAIPLLVWSVAIWDGVRVTSAPTGSRKETQTT